MDAEYSRALLDILIENASRILLARFGLDRAEATFFDIIDLLREDPSLKEDFLARVRTTLERRHPWGSDEGSVPRELIELAAHELRWPEFKELAEARLRDIFKGDSSLASSDMVRSIPAAYDDDWEDREFYRRYGAESGTRGKLTYYPSTSASPANATVRHRWSDWATWIFRSAR
jgi:hypothetical protein